jgi:hypothetical protein
MAKVAKQHALRIAVAREWENHPEVDKLAEAGHTVTVLDLEYDLVLARCTVNWDETLWPAIDVAVKAARKRKKEAPGAKPA